jgi:glycosyltransferase involved in cell wall biosynthesis
LVSAELDVQVDLLTYGEGQNVDIAGVRILRIPRFGWFGNVKTGPSMLKLFLDIFIFLRTVGLLLVNRYDFVHAHEEAVFFSRFLKPVFRFKLVYDMHSSLPQQLSNFNYTDSRLIYRLFKWLEDSSINAADAVITICPDLADYVATVISDPDKHFLIENSIFEPVRLSNAAGTAAVDDEPDLVALPADRKYFVYAGTLEHYQGIGLLIRAFRLVLESCPRAYLIIVGGTPEQVEKYSQLAAEEGITDGCRFTGRVPQKSANAYTSLASVQVSPRTEGTNTPLKIYQQLASGIPLVATDIYSHTQVLDRKVAFLAAPEPQDFAQAMISAISEPDKAQRITAGALRLYEDEYSRKRYVDKLQQLLATLK